MVARAFAAFAAEFPNDNPELHLGTIWMCEQVCGAPEAHLPAEPSVAPAEEPPEAVVEVEPPAAVVEPPAALVEPPAAGAIDEEGEEPIEIVESIVLEGPIELVPAPLESGMVASLSDFEDGPGLAKTSAAEPVDRAAGAEAPERGRGAETRLVSTPPPPINDPFEAFLQTLSDVACEAGHTFAASEIGAALAGDAVAVAWRAILNGESEDFSLCGTPLDEWASAVLGRIISAPHKAASLRRELRARGVAAFGLVEAA